MISVPIDYRILAISEPRNLSGPIIVSDMTNRLHILFTKHQIINKIVSTSIIRWCRHNNFSNQMLRSKDICVTKLSVCALYLVHALYPVSSVLCPCHMPYVLNQLSYVICPLFRLGMREGVYRETKSLAVYATQMWHLEYIIWWHLDHSRCKFVCL